MKRKVFRIIYFTIVAAIIILGAYPSVRWQIEPEKPLDLLIIDKTVPDESYREHKGLVWVLNANKYLKLDGSNYQSHKDYYGFFPRGDSYQIRDLPRSLAGPDLIYITDTYGVYEEDYAEQAIDDNDKLYGGITSSDIASIKKALYEEGTTLIAEFNTFASPSNREERKELYRILGLEWSGWIGRYFLALEDTSSIPDWLIENYEDQYHQSYDLSGEGYLFVHEDGRLVVLKEEDLAGGGIRVHFSEDAKDRFNVQDEVYYNYWFDIINPVKTKTLANYEFELNAQGERILQEAGIPISFPAVMQYTTALYDAYYFAGDYSDLGDVSEFYTFYGLDWIKKVFSMNTKMSEDPFYWKVYVPMMKQILAEHENREKRTPNEPPVEMTEDYAYNTRVTKDYFEVLVEGQWKRLKIAGVNLGMAKPGYFPGEAKITQEEYLRWFQQIKAMGANAIRVYTIHPPDFYSALYEFNKTREEPLYVFHGIWVEEEAFLEEDSVDNPAFVEEIQKEARYTIDVIHGQATLPERPGHASGDYRYDVSPYIIGWIFGIEWDPNVVLKTNQGEVSRNPTTYLETSDASSFEGWLGSLMDYALTYEIEAYQWTRPISFTNWPTTDLLDHPNEPFEHEDMVAINPNHILAKDRFRPGVFAAYHIYPNYPDFFNMPMEGEDQDSYELYLNQLRAAHQMPVLVAEFGVPSSRGIGRYNPYGYSQGNFSEEEQGQKNAKLYETIISQDYAGGILFSWQDEWFKKSWNIAPYDNQEKRAYWANAQTYEEHYGLLAFDASREADLVLGENEELWRSLSTVVPSVLAKEEATHVTGLKMDSDEKNLYLSLVLSDDFATTGQDTSHYIYIDVIPGQGVVSPQGLPLGFPEGMDFQLEIRRDGQAYLQVDPYYSPVLYEYGYLTPVIEEYQKPQKSANEFSPIYMMQNARIIVPDSGQVIPTRLFDTGALQLAEGQSTLGDYHIEGNLITIKLPWMLLNAKDPSEHEFMGNMWEEGLEASFISSGLGLAIVTIDKEKEEVLAYGPLKDRSYDLATYTWPGWDLPSYTERLKASYDMMKEVYERHTGEE